MKEIIFCTSNQGKILEAQKVLNQYNLKVIPSDDKGVEIQSDSLEEVAKVCAQNAYSRLKKPLFAEDSGLFIDALNGFPGVYSSFALKKIGCEGILRLLGQERQRPARFKCAIAYCDAQGPQIFRGEVEGRISNSIIEGEGFGYDPIFIPWGHDKPFSLIMDVKNKISHRSKALQKLGRFLSQQ